MVSAIKLKKIIFAIIMVATFTFVGIGENSVQAQNTIYDNVCRNFSGSKPPGCNPTSQQLDKPGRGSSNPNETYVRTLVNAFIVVAGTLSVIFLLIGAIRYITATGNSARIQQAKDTVLYSIIGLIVVALAVPISDFVIDRL